jgi:restriction endonuclease XhoI-like protein
MAPSRKDLDVAIAAYWATKEKQRAAAEAIRSKAEGTAKAVRGGKQFNPVVNLIARFFLDAGYPVKSIAASGRGVVLPGYFRPNKKWDLVVVHEEVLVAAIELKSLGNPSFGKNYNNRIEEALGNAIDLDQAYQAGLAGREKPWLGYFFLMDDAEKSRCECHPRENPNLKIAPEWAGLSYQERFAIAGKRLIDEGLYDAVCYVTASPADPLPKEPDPRLDWNRFSAAIEARLKYLSSLSLP